MIYLISEHTFHVSSNVSRSDENWRIVPFPQTRDPVRRQKQRLTWAKSFRLYKWSEICQIWPIFVHLGQMVVNSHKNPERSAESVLQNIQIRKKISEMRTYSRSSMIVQVLRDELVDLLYSNSTKGYGYAQTRFPLALLSRDLLKKILLSQTLTRCNYVGSMSVHHPWYPCDLC